MPEKINRTANGIAFDSLGITVVHKASRHTPRERLQGHKAATVFFPQHARFYEKGLLHEMQTGLSAFTSSNGGRGKFDKFVIALFTVSFSQLHYDVIQHGYETNSG